MTKQDALRFLEKRFPGVRMMLMEYEMLNTGHDERFCSADLPDNNLKGSGELSL